MLSKTARQWLTNLSHRFFLTKDFEDLIRDKDSLSPEEFDAKFTNLERRDALYMKVTTAGIVVIILVAALRLAGLIGPSA